MNKRAIITGAGGFIGSHLAIRLKKEGFWVRGIDLKYPEFLKTSCDEFIIGDLRDPKIVEVVIPEDIDELYQFACYDNQTEVLTDQGFKLFKDLNKTEKLATLNKDGYLEYQKPVSYYNSHKKREMYHFLSKSIDIMVTPDHNMYLQKPKTDNRKQSKRRLICIEREKQKKLS